MLKVFANFTIKLTFLLQPNNKYLFKFVCNTRSPIEPNVDTETMEPLTSVSECELQMIVDKLG